MKKNKIIPIVITSRESMEASVADIVRLKLEYAERTAAMEQEIAAVQKKHQDAILSVARQIEIFEASVYMFCQNNRATLFPEKKSLDTLLAEVGFRLNPPSVEKIKNKDTWGTIALRLQASEWGKDYVREADPEVNKAALLAKRTELNEADLKKVGLVIEQEENFYIDPKSQIAERTTKAA